MKDQYVGDVNDYLKYALLRAIAGPDELSVIWMLTRDDGRSDGQRLRYLASPGVYRDLDPTLFDTLAGVVSDKRAVRLIEAARILPAIAFVSQIVPDDVAARAHYLETALADSAAASIVFFDPDNGLGVSSVRKGARNSSKYVYVDELAQAYDLGHSLIVYQHFPRRERGAFLSDVAANLRQALACNDVLALRTPHVAFLVVPQADATPSLHERLEIFASKAARFRIALTVC